MFPIYAEFKILYLAHKQYWNDKNPLNIRLINKSYAYGEYMSIVVSEIYLRISPDKFKCIPPFWKKWTHCFYSVTIEGYYGSWKSIDGVNHFEYTRRYNDEDISFLKGIKNVTLHALQDVTDMSIFKNANSVTLFDMPRVVDVSSLADVPHVTLDRINVTDVSCLVKAKQLHLDRIPVKDISALKAVRWLILTKLHRIELNCLKNKWLFLNEMDMRGCVSLANIEYVRLMGPKFIFDSDNLNPLHFLLNVKRVELDNLTISDVSALRYAEKVTMRSMHRVTDVSELCNVADISLEFMDMIEDVSPLGLVHTLKLEWLRCVRNVNCLGGVRNLTLRGLSNVSDVSGLRNVGCLTMCQLCIR